MIISNLFSDTKNQLKIINSLLKEINLFNCIKLFFLNISSNFLEILSISIITSFIFNNKKYYSFSDFDLTNKFLIIYLILFISIRCIISIVIISRREEIIFSFNKNLKNELLFNFLNSNNHKLINLNRADLFSIINIEIDRTVASLNRLINFLQSILTALVYVGAILFIGKTKIIFILLTFCSILIATFVYRSRSWKLGEIESTLNKNFQSILTDGVYALKTIKASNAESWLLEKYKNVNQKYFDLIKRNILRTSIFKSLKELLTILLVTFWIILNYRDFSILDFSIILICSLKISNATGLIVINYREMINLLPGYLELKKFRERLDSSLEINRNLSENKNCVEFKNIPEYVNWENINFFKSEISKIYLRKNNPLVIVGLSGSGKTNLLDHISGLKNASDSRWEIAFGNNKLKQFFGEYGAIQFKKNISYIPQNSQLFEMTIKENILMQDYLQNIDNNFIDNKILGWIKKLNLERLLDRYGLNNKIIKTNLDNISRGEIQRLILVRSFIRDKYIEIYDEPLAGLDQINSEIIIKILKQRSLKKIILIASHNNLLINSIPNNLKL